MDIRGKRLSMDREILTRNMPSFPYLLHPLHRRGSNMEMVRFYVDHIIWVPKSRASIQYHLKNLYSILCEKGLIENFGNTKVMNSHASLLTFEYVVFNLCIRSHVV